MRYCRTCNREYTDPKRLFCSVEGTRLSLKDPFNLVGSLLVDRYRLDALVGIGGFGAVYCAHHLGIDRQVAVKILLPHFSVSNSKICELFEREAKIAGRLSHDSIVDVKDAGRTSAGLAYMVMEWLEGRTLEEEIAANGRLSFERAAEILRQISAALDEAHSLRIIHRDLKPANIMIVKRPNGQDRVKVLDFGIAKVVSSTAGSTVSIAIGTPHYASPEQLMEGGNMGTRSDIYSLGVMLYQMLAGELPFNARSLHELIRLQVTALPPPLRQARPEAPLIIERLLQTMLEKQPEDRLERASEVARRFDLGVKVEQLLREAAVAVQDHDYRLAVSKLEEAQRLSPDEPEVMGNIQAAQAAQAENERRARIDRLLREALQAFDSGEYGAAIYKWEEVLQLSPGEPGVRIKVQSARVAQQSAADEAAVSQSAQDSGPAKESRPTQIAQRRWLIIAGLAVALIAIVVGAVWLARSNNGASTPPDTPTPVQSRAEAPTNSNPAPAAEAPTKVAAMTYYLATEDDDGKMMRATEAYSFKPEQRFKLHFTPRSRGYLYIIAAGTQLEPTTYLTAKPTANTYVKTNKLAAGADYVFPGADQWMRFRKGLDMMVITVIFSQEPLQSPAYLASTAGQRLTAEEYDQLVKRLFDVEPELAGDQAIVKVATKGEDAQKVLLFKIRINGR